MPLRNLPQMRGTAMMAEGGVGIIGGDVDEGYRNDVEVDPWEQDENGNWVRASELRRRREGAAGPPAPVIPNTPAPSVTANATNAFAQMQQAPAPLPQMRSAEEIRAQAEEESAKDRGGNPLTSILGGVSSAYNAVNEKTDLPFGAGEFIRDTVRPAVSYGLANMDPRLSGKAQSNAVTDFAASLIPSTGLEVALTVPGTGKAAVKGLGVAERALGGVMRATDPLAGSALPRMAAGLGGRGDELAQQAVKLGDEAVVAAPPRKATTPTKLVGDLRPFDDVANEVVTSDNPVVRGFQRATGINPSVLENTDVGKALTTFMRQRSAADELTQTALAAGLDTHAQAVTGRMGQILPINNEGLMDITRNGIKGKATWNDVFSRPGNFDLNPAQQSYVNDYKQIINEVEDMRVQAGLKPRAVDGEDGWGYIPRQVKNIRGVDLNRPSNANLQRLYDDAVEGYAKGVRYDRDPRATLELHVRNAMREITEKQLADALEPLSVRANQLVPAPIRQRMENAVKARQIAERDVRARSISRPVAAAEREVRGQVAAQRREALGVLAQARDALRASRQATTGLSGQVRGEVAAARRLTDEAFRAITPEIRAANQELRAAQRIGMTPELPKPLSGEQVQLAQRAIRAAEKEADLLLRMAGDDVASATGSAISAQREALLQARDQLASIRSILQPPQRLRQTLAADRAAADSLLAEARKEYQVAKNAYSRAMESARRAEVAPGSLFNREGTIPVAQWRNRVFPREDAEKLNEAIGRFTPKGEVQWPSLIAKGVGTTANYTRFLASAGDFAAPFIQGLPVLARNPVAWGRATANHYQAFLNPKSQATFIRDHIETFQEMARYGVPIGDTEFFSVLREGQGLSLGGVLGPARGVGQQVGKQTYGRFGASYNAMLGSARALLWESSKLEPTARAQFIRNMTGGLDPRALGVSPNQREVEGMWMAFSPRLLRSTVALVADAMKVGTPEGREALRTLGSLAAGTAAMYYLTGQALGKSNEEIAQGLNPLNGKKFLSHEVNGDWIGVGGQIRSMTQLIAKAATDPESLVSGNQFDNPLLAFYMSRGAPAMNIAGAAVEAASGGKLNTSPFENIDSLPDLAKHIGTSALPFALQGLLEGQNWETSAASEVGARTSPETIGEKMADARVAALQEVINAGDFPPAIAQALGGADYYTLGPREREVVDTRLKETNPELLAELQKSRRENGSVFQAAQDRIAEYETKQAQEMDGLLDGLLKGGDPKKILERLDDLKNQLRGFKDNEYSSPEYKNAVEDLPENDIQLLLDKWYSIPGRVSKDGVVDWDKAQQVRAAFLKEVAAKDTALANRLAFNVQDKVQATDHKLIQLVDAAQPTLDAYYALDETKRAGWRATHPKEDAQLFVLGYVTTVRSVEAQRLAEQMVKNREVKLAR